MEFIGRQKMEENEFHPQCLHTTNRVSALYFALQNGIIESGQSLRYIPVYYDGSVPRLFSSRYAFNEIKHRNPIHSTVVVTLLLSREGE